MSKTFQKTIALAAALLVTSLALLSAMRAPEEQTAAFAAGNTLQLGDRGDTVRQIQQRLKDWGYYFGSVDGIFGTQTQQAVIRFQRANRLVPDGIVGPATAAKIGISLIATTSANRYQADISLLAHVVYGEARGEPYMGQVAVAAVVLNRVKSASFPNSISGVVYQPGAFSIVADGQINLQPDAEAIRAAKDAYNGYDPTSGCLFYYNPATTTSQWMLNKIVYLRIGHHAFCR